MFYIYAYIRKSDGTPYYIGKGKNDRINKKHIGISVPKDKSMRLILEKNLTEIGALALERFYIRWYGRKDLKTGILINRTEGGEGTTGKVCNESTRKKISNANKGRQAWNKGKSWSDTSKNKLSVRKLGSTNQKTRKQYEITHPDNTKELIVGLDQWCKANNLHTGNMSSVAKGHLKHYKNYKCRIIHSKGKT